MMRENMVIDALQDALALCAYLGRHWPEVGVLPSVQETAAQLRLTLAALDMDREVRS